MDARRDFDGSIPTTDSEIVDMILRHEGGIYTNHPADKGGPTKWGITKPVLAKWRGVYVSDSDIEHLERDEAGNIYQVRFILPFAAFEKNTFRANTIDMGVNAGISRAVRLMQQTIGTTVDGVIGPKTIEAAKTRDWNPLYVGVRIAFYERIVENDGTQIVWRNGWRNRALSFYGKAHRLPLRVGHGPVFGFQGKAYL